MTAKEGIRYLSMKCDHDEPVFILKASDALASSTVLFWADMAERSQVNEAKVCGALTVSREMREWTNTNSSRLPD